MKKIIFINMCILSSLGHALPEGEKSQETPEEVTVRLQAVRREAPVVEAVPKAVAEDGPEEVTRRLKRKGDVAKGLFNNEIGEIPLGNKDEPLFEPEEMGDLASLGLIASDTGGMPEADFLTEEAPEQPTVRFEGPRKKGPDAEVLAKAALPKAEPEQATMRLNRKRDFQKELFERPIDVIPLDNRDEPMLEPQEIEALPSLGVIKRDEGVPAVQRVFQKLPASQGKVRNSNAIFFQPKSLVSRLNAEDFNKLWNEMTPDEPQDLPAQDSEVRRRTGF